MASGTGPARDLIRGISDKPIQYVPPIHFHAAKVPGASVYSSEFATESIANQGTQEIIVERDKQMWATLQA
ncbi:MAG: hypothetical protein JSR49_02815 [Proteobacteria bacterium]|nr:hypothetical protein [Pseudomonadota bacterium]